MEGQTFGGPFERFLEIASQEVADGQIDEGGCLDLDGLLGLLRSQPVAFTFLLADHVDESRVVLVTVALRHHRPEERANSTILFDRTSVITSLEKLVTFLLEGLRVEELLMERGGHRPHLVAT